MQEIIFFCHGLIHTGVFLRLLRGQVISMFASWYIHQFLGTQLLGQIVNCPDIRVDIRVDIRGARKFEN